MVPYGGNMLPQDVDRYSGVSWSKGLDHDGNIGGIHDNRNENQRALQPIGWTGVTVFGLVPGGDETEPTALRLVFDRDVPSETITIKATALVQLATQRLTVVR